MPPVQSPEGGGCLTLIRMQWLEAGAEQWTIEML